MLNMLKQHFRIAISVQCVSNISLESTHLITAVRRAIV